MDFQQLLFLCSLFVTCNAGEFSTLVDFTSSIHQNHIAKLRKVETQTKLHMEELLPPHSPRISSNRHKGQGKAKYNDMDCDESFRCPNSTMKIVCINRNDLCNSKKDCPDGEDEDGVSCLFFKMTNHFLTKTIARTKANEQRLEDLIIQTRWRRRGLF